MITVPVLIFIFGLFVGSFLNALIYRLKTKREILWARSICPYCKHKLGFFDLIPVLSFLFLRGKCRYCHKKISWQYPFIEIVTGLAFILVYFKVINFNFSNIFYLSLPINLINLFSWFCFVGVLIVIFVFDLRYYIIPSELIYFGLSISLIYWIVYFLIERNFSFHFQSFLGSVIVGMFFFFLFLISNGKWLGRGDVSFGFLIGLVLGWPKILVGLFSAFVFGGVLGLILVISHQKKMTEAIPFGPILSLFTFLTWLFGDFVIDYYLKLLGL